MKRKLLAILSLAVVMLATAWSCAKKNACHDEMVSILDQVHKASHRPANQFYPEAGLVYMDSLLSLEHSTPSQIRYCQYLKANILLELGEEEKAIALLEGIVKEDNEAQVELAWRDLAVAYLRQGERANCISNHAAESCLMPVKGMGVHSDPTGSRKAIEIYQRLLTRHPNDFESGWLLNLAYMTLGEYPKSVPAKFLIPGLEGDTTVKVNPFQDVAADLKLDVKNMAGGSVVEDFDNDGYLDLLTSGMGTEEAMHYFKNNGDGTFTDRSNQVGLKGISGGLNMVQADYNNDGFVDVLVLRGAWKKQFGEEPNSLLRNNGDGTFTDVTTEAGLLSYHPTQTATWNDFNNDGWLDLYIGNESVLAPFEVPHYCEFYISNRDGTFREVAAKTGSNVLAYVKGVTSGDYDHDGWKDIFLSTMNGERILLKNMGLHGQEISFENVTHSAGVGNTHGNTFPTWFWDYDNDGWLDIFACDYSFKNTLAYYAAAEKLHVPAGNPEKMLLYHNNHDGTFTNVADSLGLTRNTFAMGSNFGDIDNDGWLDMYLGTGNPDYKSLVPNKMFKNLGGKKFADVTTSARVGHLQKGHGVSFADMDNDGDQDIYIEMGGAFPGDAYQNSFFLNPGQSNNRWICLKLEGTEANRGAIGTSLKITFTENGVKRSVYRDVNSGGSFGASPLRREIGVGQANVIDEIEIKWHGSKNVQVFKNVGVNQFLKIKEGSDKLEKVNLKMIIWSLPEKLCLPLAGNATTPAAVRLQPNTL
ncbi:FG-GAP-like repeat-containing protein [Chryseolinea lacunae]|uniref:VCBS repeat-containing protein n=1 Tax=Chryseolinea lacunae TaxID=2801331 RepID=A0ABS1KMT0_9BACT|nr:FG-GAP-like repeat-containing protein [Chryseolinea lacunae]MBL0740769.1 VCBS repeat-containing protein [Chryseolinea lacunae]